jgi:hypothetical protein
MLTIYLACLMFGGVLLAVSILAGAYGEMDHAVGDVDHAMDVDAHGFDLHASSHGEGLTAAIKFLSFRNIVFFLAFFGLTGTVLTWIRIPSLITPFFAVGMGWFAAAFGQKIMTYLKKTESGAEINLQDLEGLRALVVINVAKNRRGKISVVANDRRLQLLAVVADEESKDEFKYGESVTIVKIENGIAHVASEEFIR